MSYRSFKTNRNRPDYFEQDDSPEYIPDSPYDSDDDEFDEDEPAYLAPIGGYNYLRKVEEVAPINMISQEEIQRIKTLGTKMFNSNLFSTFNDGDSFFLDDYSFEEFESIVETKLSTKELKQRAEDPDKVIDKFFSGLIELEKDHDFSDPHLNQMVYEDVKEPVRDMIRSGIIKLDIKETDEDKSFISKEIVSLLAGKRKAFTNVTELAKHLSNDVQSILEVFRKSMDRFINIQKNNSRPPIERILNSELGKKLRKVLQYDDFKEVLNYDILQQISLVYIPSGGGKSFLTRKNPKLFHDVDQIVKDNYDLFKKIQQLCNQFRRYKSFIMNKFFKYCLSNLSTEILTTKVLLMNHPNQVPSWMKFRRNELILIPNTWRIRTRFFCENLASLLLVYRYVKKVIDPNLYFQAINDFFKFEERVIHSDETTPANSPVSITSADLWFS